MFLTELCLYIIKFCSYFAMIFTKISLTLFSLHIHLTVLLKLVLRKLTKSLFSKKLTISTNSKKRVVAAITRLFHCHVWYIVVCHYINPTKQPYAHLQCVWFALYCKHLIPSLYCLQDAVLGAGFQPSSKATYFRFI